MMYDFNQNGMYNGLNSNQFSSNNKQNPQIKTYSFVNGVEGAKAYTIMPSTNTLLMDADNPICYMKSADNLGKCSLRYFKLEEIDEATARSMTQPPIPPQAQYATKHDIDSLNQKIDELMKVLGNKQPKQDVKPVNK